jgi:hypothetical protein
MLAVATAPEDKDMDFDTDEAGPDTAPLVALATGFKP